jgi:hypothetical protein
VTAPQFVILGVCQGHDGAVYVLALHPYSVLKFVPADRRTTAIGR